MKDLISSRSQWLRHFFFATHWKTMLLLLVLCVGFNANAQNLTVSGTVVDGTDEPMIGATVQVMVLRTSLSPTSMETSPLRM